MTARAVNSKINRADNNSELVLICILWSGGIGAAANKSKSGDFFGIKNLKIIVIIFK